MFDRDTLSDRRQLMLYGLSLLFAFLATELGFMQRLFGTTSLRAQEWLLCVGVRRRPDSDRRSDQVLPAATAVASRGKRTLNPIQREFT